MSACNDSSEVTGVPGGNLPSSGDAAGITFALLLHLGSQMLLRKTKSEKQVKFILDFVCCVIRQLYLEQQLINWFFLLWTEHCPQVE